MYEIILGIVSTLDSRPIPEYAPQPYVALMKQCLDVDNAKRPTTNHLAQTLHGWFLTLIGHNQPIQAKGLTGLRSRWFSDLIKQIKKIIKDCGIRKAFTNNREQQWQNQRRRFREKSIIYAYI